MWEGCLENCNKTSALWAWFDLSQLMMAMLVQTKCRPWPKCPQGKSAPSRMWLWRLSLSLGLCTPHTLWAWWPRLCSLLPGSGAELKGQVVLPCSPRGAVHGSSTDSPVLCHCPCGIFPNECRAPGVGNDAKSLCCDADHQGTPV